MCYFSVHREVHFLKICREHFIVDLRNLLKMKNVVTSVRWEEDLNYLLAGGNAFEIR